MIELCGKSYNCEKELTLSVIGGKWKMLILWHLGKEDKKRFNELDLSCQVSLQECSSVNCENWKKTSS